MHRELALTKVQKDEIREKHMRERDEFEMNNLGNFTRAFPSNDSVRNPIVITRRYVGFTAEIRITASTLG